MHSLAKETDMTDYEHYTDNGYRQTDGDTARYQPAGSGIDGYQQAASASGTEASPQAPRDAGGYRQPSSNEGYRPASTVGEGYQQTGNASYRHAPSSTEQASQAPSSNEAYQQVANTTQRLPRNEAPQAPSSFNPVYAQHASGSHARPAASQPAAAQRTVGNTDAAPRYAATPSAQRHAAANMQAASTTPSASAASAKTAKKGGGLRSFLLGFLGAALAFVLLSFATGSFGLTGGKALNAGNDNAPAATQSESSEDKELAAVEQEAQIPSTDAEWRAETVAAKVLPSIAAIDTYATASGYGFWGSGGTSANSGALQALGLGSGVVISSDGYILTNFHVVEGAEKVMVTVDGQEFEGTVAGTDAASDLAVIKVESETPLTAVEIGNSSELRPGQWVMTLGSPFGLEQSVATGIVSAVSRTIVMGTSDYSYGGQSEATSIYANMIQTDAAINPGNSGGALVDEHGKLIGINSVIESYSGNYAGVGFAIPVDYAMNIAQQIIDGKTPTHAQLGVATTTVTASLADSYDLGSEKGAYVRVVYENSGASEAGLQEGDISTKVNDTAIETSTDLVAAVRAYNVGDTVTITYVRGDQTQTVDIVLGSDENANISVGPNRPSEEQLNEYFGSPDQGQGQDGQGYTYEELKELLDYFGYN